jgi:hypothetical protein
MPTENKLMPIDFADADVSVKIVKAACGFSQNNYHSVAVEADSHG